MPGIFSLLIFRTPAVRGRTSNGRLARSQVRKSQSETPLRRSEGIFRSSGLWLAGMNHAARRSEGTVRRSEGPFASGEDFVTPSEGTIGGSAGPGVGRRQLFLTRWHLLQASGKEHGVQNSQQPPATSQKLVHPGSECVRDA